MKHWDEIDLFLTKCLAVVFGIPLLIFFTVVYWRGAKAEFRDWLNR